MILPFSASLRLCVSAGDNQGVGLPFILFMSFMVNPASPLEAMLFLSAPLRLCGRQS